MLRASKLAASVLRPYVRQEVYWVVKMHGLFQMPYYAHHLGLPVDGHLAFAPDVLAPLGGYPWDEDKARSL